MSEIDADAPEAIAVIGMAGRFPGARNLEEFWRNLREGRETVSFFSDEEMIAAGTDPTVLKNPSFVKAGAILDDVELFDATFFGFSPREAEILDPQQRVFLESAWEALERAGYVSESFEGWVGVFAGISMSTYLWKNLGSHPEVLAEIGDFQAILGNDRDYFTTRVSYKLNLKGPSVNVQTACSTSLVAVHLACQSLLNYQSTLALAGGVRINFPQKMGYFHQEGGIFSPDGRCRAFDARGAGALFGEGVGVVLLKRLSEALADGDTIHAVIRGSAMNNDGSLKVGYTAPSVEGQAEAIAMAQTVAGVPPSTITYVETHGSGTPLGDPIEVAALTEAFRAGTDERGFCALGSVKTNVGHLEAAAGVAGLIKTVLALEHATLPPSLHFERPNPRIDFAGSPFYVNTEAREWMPAAGAPRRAGVSSFGMGGTNVHLVLEEAPAPWPGSASRPWQLLVLSARTATALATATGDLAAHLADHPEQDLADVASTLQAGRRSFPHRTAVVCRDREDAVAALRDPRRRLAGVAETEPQVAWMLSGLGEHHPRMGEGLYAAEPAFRAALDRCAEILSPHLGLDLRDELYPGGARLRTEGAGGLDLRRLLGREGAAPGEDPAAARLTQTWLAQPAVFAVEYALAQVWMEWGIGPRALVGYSLGEYTAACLAGVLSLEQALPLVAERARLIDRLPPGAMLAVPLPEAEAVALLEREGGGELSLAAVNGQAFSVVAGPVEAVAALEARLAEREVASRRLPTTHAFHSRMMDPVAPKLAELLRRVELKPPAIPLLSNVTGTWMTAAEATDPAAWARQLCRPVRFGDALAELAREPARLLLEVGPGQALATIALQSGAGLEAVRSMRHPHESRPDAAVLLDALGRLWLAGARVDWTGFAAHERRRRVPLPTSPFERQRFFIEPRRLSAGVVATTSAAGADGAGALPDAPGTAASEPPAAALGRHARPVLRTAYAEPEGPLAPGIAGIFADLLGLDRVGAHDSFFELGGNSLVAPRLVLKLRDRFAVDLPLAALFDAPTPARLAEAVELVHREGSAAALASAPVDLRAEVALDPAVDPSSLPAADWRRPRAVVLTGATGFLGAFLLRDLAMATAAHGTRIVCPVRAASAEEALGRLRANLEARQVWDDALATRIEAVPADLGLPRWGLSEGEFRRLAVETDAIYHGGAWVNFTYPYRILKPVNVEGTAEALRLAATETVKPVHFISSVAVFSPRVFRHSGVAFEDRELEHTEGLFGGYGETKWVGEQLVELARARGIPAAVYRPGVVSGDSRTGAGNTRDMIWNMMKGCIQLGIAPDWDFAVDVTPVDYVSRALVHLSLRPESPGHAFHFPNPRPMRWGEALPVLRAYGYEIELVPYPRWQRRVAEVVPNDPNSALLPFLPILLPAGGPPPESAVAEGAPPAAETILDPQYDQTNTQAGLAGSGITCPPVDETLLRTYLDAFVASGWLAPPGAPAPTAILESIS